MHRSDPSLIQACLSGDSVAWGEIVERYNRLVYSIPRRYGMSEADADDVFQSVFLILHQKLDTLQDQTRLSSWLITTTHRECWRTGRKKSSFTELTDRMGVSHAPGDDQIDRWEREDLVHRALNQLGGQCQRLLEALFLQPSEESYESVAERLGMKPGSIGPTRARCFGKLERILRDLGYVPGPDS